MIPAHAEAEKNIKIATVKNNVQLVRMQTNFLVGALGEMFASWKYSATNKRMYFSG